MAKISITIPDELYEALRVKAEERNTTVEALIIDMIRKFVSETYIPVRSLERIRRELFDLVNKLTSELQRRINMALERSEVLEERIEKARADIEELKEKVNELWEDYQKRLEWRRKRYKRSTSL
ncbi:MAG TPA: ribbon-helix-helix protein, CopG family [Desulfurococcales archaeon]|nr:ribbon-helix-helix protein, CopG family [Desulfurococcales archaeon]